MPMPRDIPKQPPDFIPGGPHYPEVDKKGHAADHWTRYSPREATWLGSALGWLYRSPLLADERQRKTCVAVLSHILHFTAHDAALPGGFPFVEVTTRQLAAVTGIGRPAIIAALHVLASPDPSDGRPLVLVWKPPKHRSDRGSVYALGMGYSPDGVTSLDLETAFGGGAE